MSRKEVEDEGVGTSAEPGALPDNLNEGECQRVLGRFT